MTPCFLRCLSDVTRLSKYLVDPSSRCQIEVDIAWTDLISHSTEGEYGKVAPLRVLSFDIECAGRKGVFPEADKDPGMSIVSLILPLFNPTFNPTFLNFIISLRAQIHLYTFLSRNLPRSSWFSLNAQVNLMEKVG